MHQPRTTASLWLCLLCWLCAVHVAVAREQSDDDRTKPPNSATDVSETSSSASASLPRYLFHPTYQQPASSSPPTTAPPPPLNYTLVPFSLTLSNRRITGRVLTLHSPPQSHFSVYPPPSGCGAGRSSVSDSARHWRCEVAMNAGFFQIDEPAAFCLNAVVSDGTLLQEQAQFPNSHKTKHETEVEEERRLQAAEGGPSNVRKTLSSTTNSATNTVVSTIDNDAELQPKPLPPAIQSPSTPSADTAPRLRLLSQPVDPTRFAHQNVHFGVTSDSRYFVGHVNHTLLARHSTPSSHTWHFTQLVSGVVWLVRNAHPHATHSWQHEEDQSTPVPATSFDTAISARTAIGHDSEGRLMLLLVEGKTGVSGVGLQGLAELCVRVGMVNAINTDGGGSATLVERGVLVNEPSETDCYNAAFEGQTCERPVTTIACLHASRQNWTDALTATASESIESRHNTATSMLDGRVWAASISDCVVLPLLAVALISFVACAVLCVLVSPACRACALRFCPSAHSMAVQAAARTGATCWQKAARSRTEEENGLLADPKADV